MSTPAPEDNRSVPLRRPLSGRAFALGAVLGLSGLAATAVGAGVAAAGQLPDPEKVAPGIRIAEVEVGGLTREEATERVKDWARGQMRNTVTLSAPGQRFSFTLGDLGGRFGVQPAVDAAWQVGKDDNFFERLYHGSRPRGIEIPIAFLLAEDRLDLQLNRLGKRLYRPARNARAKMDPKGRLVLAAKEEIGQELDLPATRAALLQGGIDALRRGAASDLILTERMPRITAADLGKLGTQLSAFGTNYASSSWNRKQNVALAASKIDGTILAPGEVFSYNGIVGPREAKRGWKMAHQYQDGQVVDGIGGGVCQVSSTLYNAVLLADLKVVQRSNHSMPVAYLRAGRDATVSYNNIDFRFENSTPGPLLIAARTDGQRLLFRIFGAQSPERHVLDIVSSGRSYSATGGFSVSTYRQVQNPDGTVAQERISTDYYRPPKPVERPRPVARKKPAPPPAAAATPAPTASVPAPSGATR